MFPIAIDDIQHLSEDDLDALAELDSKGLLIGAGETLADSRARWRLLAENVAELESEVDEKGEILLFDFLPLRSTDRMSPEILAEASSRTLDRYAFAVDWVPGYFASKSLGFLWGGCALAIQDPPLILFIIRAAFKDSPKWFIYRREELLSHELCHVARTPLRDKAYEEHFAYQLSFSRLRRFMGNCFQSQWDGLLFVGPVLLLLAAQLTRAFTPLSIPIVPFWVLAFVFPFFLFARNAFHRRLVFTAAKRLRQFGVARPEAVLFRCVAAEVKAIARTRGGAEFAHWLDERASSEPRWKVVRRRFIESRP